MTLAESDNHFRQFLGHDVPGGCDRCDSFQRFRQIDTGIWNVTIHHEETCPTYLQIKRRTRKARR